MKSIHIPLAVLIAVAISCSAPAPLRRTPSENEGRAIVFLQPIPREAERIRFSIEGISALHEDGKEIPLSLSFGEIKGSDRPGNQRLLASGLLQRGRYKGLSVKIRKASLLREEGEAALLIPGNPVVMEQRFDIMERKNVPLFLAFLSSHFLTDGNRFTPAFSMLPPSRPLVDLTGYVTIPDFGAITVFDKKRMHVTGFIDTPGTPSGIALDQAGRKAYVANSHPGSVEILDLFSGEIIGRIPLNFGDSPRELAITPDGRTLVSANYGTGTVSVIDADSQFVSKRIKVGEGPAGVVVDRRGLKAYVMNSLSNSISVIDLARKELLTNITAQGVPLKGDFNRAGDRLYVVCKFSPDLLIVDPVKLARVGKIFVGVGANSIKVDTQTDLIFVGNETAGEIAILDPFFMAAIDRVNVRGTPSFMAIDRDEGSLLVVNRNFRNIQKVNIVSRKIVSEMEPGGGAHGIIVMGER